MNNNTTVYIGMDVHHGSFTLCSLAEGEETPKNVQTIPADYLLVVKYINGLRKRYGEETDFICGYEAGCLGYSLYRSLKDCGQKCIILAPTTMAIEESNRRIKTDKRDAKNIAKCLRNHTYRAVHIPTEEDEQIKEFIRMRDDVKANLKRIKQQLLAFCLRHGWVYSETKHYWTQVHLKWLEQLKLEGVYQEVLDGYLIELKHLMETIDRYDKRIEALSQRDIYREPVNQLTCFLGVKRPTALSVLVEVGDFRRFPSAERFAAYLGIVPGEHSSSDSRNRLGITKAGNGHIRRLLVEAAQSYARGKVGYKSKVLIKRQEGNSAKVIAYADRANERLRRKYFQMMYRSKHSNVAKTAVARALACFMWGMMTGRIE